MAPGRQRYAGIGGRAQGSGDTGYQLIGNLVDDQCLQFVEDVGEDGDIAPFQPDDQFPLQGMFYQQVIDDGLRSRIGMMRLFADRDDQCILPDVIVKDLRAYQPVCNDDIRAVEPAKGLDREQLGITGSCSRQNDFTDMDSFFSHRSFFYWIMQAPTVTKLVSSMRMAPPPAGRSL